MIVTSPDHLSDAWVQLNVHVSGESRALVGPVFGRHITDQNCYGWESGSRFCDRMRQTVARRRCRGVDVLAESEMGFCELLANLFVATRVTEQAN